MFVFVDLQQLKLMPGYQLKAFLESVRLDGFQAGEAARSFDPRNSQRLNLAEEFLKDFERQFPNFLKESTENYGKQLEYANAQGFVEAFKKLQNQQYVSSVDPRFTSIFQYELEETASLTYDQIGIAQTALKDTITKFLETVVRDKEKENLLKE